MAPALTQQQIEQFQHIVQEYYRVHGRHALVWRRPEATGAFDPYKILVSEVMLQQTQVPRVAPKFDRFITLFPSFEALAAAPLSQVLQAWSGLGYNRRAKFLWQAARAIVQEHGGELPQALPELVALPGVGPNTAGALLAYAFNQPVVFVETNIRTVYLHHFFAEAGRQGERVDDCDIKSLLQQTLPDQPREWYWAVMDYGTHLKQTIGNLNVLSKHYTKQSSFVGSRRQIRGQVIRVLGQGQATLGQLQQVITDERLNGVLAELLQEGLIAQTTDGYTLP